MWRDGDRGEETVQLQRRRSFSLGTAAVSAGAPESELTRHLNEMNFLSAHRSGLADVQNPPGSTRNACTRRAYPFLEHADKFKSLVLEFLKAPS